MQQNNEQPIEGLVMKMMQEMNIESPSADFTSHLMMRVQLLPSGKSMSYQPLISKTGWVLILICIMALFGIIIANTDSSKTGWFHLDGMNHFLINSSQAIQFFQFSTVSIYAVAITTVMLFVHINMLINRYQRQLGFH